MRLRRGEIEEAKQNHRSEHLIRIHWFHGSFLRGRIDLSFLFLAGCVHKLVTPFYREAISWEIFGFSSWQSQT